MHSRLVRFLSCRPESDKYFPLFLPLLSESLSLLICSSPPMFLPLFLPLSLLLCSFLCSSPCPSSYVPPMFLLLCSSPCPPCPSSYIPPCSSSYVPLLFLLFSLSLNNLLLRFCVYLLNSIVVMATENGAGPSLHAPSLNFVHLKKRMPRWVTGVDPRRDIGGSPPFLAKLW